MWNYRITGLRGCTAGRRDLGFTVLAAGLALICLSQSPDAAGGVDPECVGQPAGTPCTDTDNNDCTIAECDGAGVCDQNADFESFGTFCNTGLPGCFSGSCFGPSCEPIPTPCPDTDGNPCTEARCNLTGCNQDFPVFDGTPCPDTDNNDCTIAECDGNGVCDQNADFEFPGEPCDTGLPGCLSGSCFGPNCEPNPNPCTDTDGNSCTEAWCGPTGCNQNAVVHPDGTACDDDSACTDPDSCLNGVCIGSNPVVCTALDQCHDPGICDPATGICSDPPSPDGTPCDDGDDCTEPDTCQVGSCVPGQQQCRVDSSKKGSLISFSKIELKWNATGALTQDTFLTIVNDYPADVSVQWYFINGDAPLAAVFNAGLLVERAHKGWNWVDCTTELTHDESNYLSAAKGTPLGCQPFTILDPGIPRGRPDPDGAPGDRILRGYALAFAVNANGNQISWNHLSGSVDIVDYANRSAWEFNGYAFQCVAEAIPGLPCCSNPMVAGGRVRFCEDGVLLLNGLQYDFAFDALLVDFYAVDSLAFSPGVLLPGGVESVLLDTDMTLYPVSVDLRQDNDGPITTKAKFDVWNQNEDGFSGTTRCITCWDQTLLSNYGSPNNFLIGNLHTDKGKARIDGIASDVCDPPGACCNLATDLDCFPTVNHPAIDRGCSQPAALLGVTDKLLYFAGPGVQSRQSDAGMTLVGQGAESAAIQWDILTPPQPLTTVEDQVAPAKVGGETSTTTTRTLSSGKRPEKK